MENWSNFYVFDGINYTINPYNAPRYDINGKKISSTERVTNIKYNGKVITDDMELIVACNTLTPTGIFSWANKQKIKGMYRTQNIIAEYFESLSKFGKYTPTVDNNWTINFKENQEFLMLLPNAATNFAKNSSMYVSTEFAMGDETIFKFRANKPVTNEPQIIALQSNLEPTTKFFDVFVDAFSSAGIKTLKYERGDFKADDTIWNYGRDVKNNKFTVYLNDTYTIFTEDNNGKRATYKIIVDNIGVKEMAAPKVWSYSNTKIAVTGKAEPGAAVYVSSMSDIWIHILCICRRCCKWTQERKN
jgi:2',3'-cyclic-nucleotide 2'-phosphodiesterase/3'-nucleotidase